MLNHFLFGALWLGFGVAGLFFLKFWFKTKDALFLFFALAFALLSIERIVLAFVFSGNEFEVYFIRLAAFALILGAILWKNRQIKR
jgi:uncharacterized membrane protein HdeD (DUF308 family)